MEYIQGSSSAPTYGISIVILLFTTQVVGRLALENARYTQSIFGARASQALCSLIYEKVLKISQTRKKFVKGDIVNFVQVDARKFIFLAEQISNVARLPLILVFSVVILFYYLEFSFFSGLGVVFCIMVLNFIIAKFSVRFQKNLMDRLDERMNLTSECIDNIQLIKFNSLAGIFRKNLLKTKKSEISQLSNISLMLIVAGFFRNG